MQIRERIEKSERESLSTYASLAAESRGRALQESEDAVRTCFMRDRDRILHSKSFRRLKRKTQVFVDPEGDHFRTRLTHTLEVAQVARTLARALRLNEDLTEAIALGHDVGHTPFGHAGEEALDEALKQYQPRSQFRHYEQSVRVLTVLENDGRGLNLTHETVDGIGGHSKGRADLSAYDGESCSSLEAAVVRVSDRIAYLNHDLDDAIRSGWLSSPDIPDVVMRIGETHSTRIGAMVNDLINCSVDSPRITFSEPMLVNLNEMKEFLFEKFYLDYPTKKPDVANAKRMVSKLFHHFVANPQLLPTGYEGIQGALDYVSGMTDRYAATQHENLFGPLIV